jgi:hypothetical protein
MVMKYCARAWDEDRQIRGEALAGLIEEMFFIIISSFLELRREDA